MAFTYEEYSESGDYTIKEKDVHYVEYIKNNESSYIDTNIIMDDGYSIYCDFTIEGLNQCAYSSYDDVRSLGIYQSADRIRYGGETVVANQEKVIKLGNRYKTTSSPTGYHIYNVNDNIITEGDYSHTVNLGKINSINLFVTRRPDGHLLNISYCKIYEFKILNSSDDLLIHLKPCLDTEGVPCMYDEVSQQYFYNQGTGTFEYKENNLYLFADNNNGVAENFGSYRLYNMSIDGNSEGVTEGIDYVDCLIGDGASYIDTDIVVQNGYTVDLTFKTMLSTTNNERIVICGSGDMFNYTYDRFGGYAIGLFGYNIAVKEIRDINSNDKNALLSTNTKFIANTKTTYSYTFTNVANQGSCIVMGQNYSDNTNPSSINYICPNTIFIYDFKIYNTEGTLLIHLRPCLDNSKVPCMYDEVSQQYFYNQGTGTFGYKKKLRNFQPVLDKNNIPCLMDKVNRKYYYNKGEGQFRTREQYNYRPISWIQGDGNSWIDINIYANPQWKYELTRSGTDASYGLVFDVGDFTRFRISDMYSSTLMYNNVAVNYNHNLGIDTSIYIVTIDKNKCYVNGVLKATATETNDVTQFTKGVRLFKTFQTRTDIYKVSKGKLYSFKMWDESNILQFDGIPVLDSNNIPCLYDKVSKQFFYNQGTGEFSYGIEELECSKVDYVEYMEFSSEAVNYRFDTGLPFDNTWSKIEIKFNTMSNNSYSTLINTSNEHYSLSSFSLKYNYGVIFFVSKTNKTNNDNFQIGEYGGVFQKNTDITLTYTPLNWNINGIDYPMNVESIDSSTGNLILCYSDMHSNRLYSYKVWDVNGELIQYLQPSVDDNEVVFLYDIISGNSIYCQQNNDLLKHGDLSDYTPISYIESNGTQYIDTGVVPIDNIEINMVCRACKEYTEVEYIQGDGASWLNTNIIPNTSTKVVVDAYSMKEDCFNGVPLFGATLEFLSYSFQTTATWLYVGKLGAKQNVGGSNFEGRHIISIDLSDTINVVNIDGVNYGENTGTTTECSTPILLFNQYDKWGSIASSTLSTAKIYSFKIYQLDELIFDGIPVLDSSNTPCLYDKVSQQFFYNQGEGTFAVGEIVRETVDKNYIMNNVFIQDTYKYKDNDTNIQPNITVSEGATLTLGENNLAFLSEEEIEQATEDGWNLL